MAISDRIQSMYEHVEDIYDSVELTGVDTTDIDKNLVNVPNTLKEGYIDIINNGTDTLYNNFPKVSGEGTSLTLNNTYQAPMRNNLKGNTSQTGTPTPTSPIPVNVVSGDNTITISNQGGTDSNTYNIDLPVENLLKTPYYTSDGTYHGVTFTTNADGSITINGTSTGNIFFNLLRDTNIEVFKDDITFTISGGTPEVELYFNGDNKFDTGQGVTYTYTSSFTNTRLVSIRVQSGKTVNTTIYPMLEKGTKANSFTPYGTTPIELCKIGNYQDGFGKSDGSNLFDKDNANILSAYFDAGNIAISTGGSKTIYIPCKPNTTYTMSKKAGARFQLAYSNTTPEIGGSILGTIANNNASSITITTGSQAKYLVSFCFGSADTDTWETIVNSIMINEGSTALLWQPYGVGKWYLHKEIGKVVLNGSEDWGVHGSIASWFYVDNLIYSISANSRNDFILSDYFVQDYYMNATTLTNGKLVYSYQVGGGPARLVLKDTDYTTVEDFKAWLSAHNTSVYYVLSTPTTTEITDTTLINQLEELYIAKSKENQTNISQINNDLGFIISASALKKG